MNNLDSGPNAPSDTAASAAVHGHAAASTPVKHSHQQLGLPTGNPIWQYARSGLFQRNRRRKQQEFVAFNPLPDQQQRYQLAGNK